MSRLCQCIYIHVGHSAAQVPIPKSFFHSRRQFGIAAALSATTKRIHWHFAVPTNGTLRCVSTVSGLVELPTSRHEILTLLHKTRSLLSRALPSKRQVDTLNYGSLEFWDKLLAGTYDDLTSTLDTTGRVGIYGVDEWSRAQDLITALLEDPFNANHLQNDAIRRRWKDRPLDQRHLKIVNNSSLASDASALQIPSVYLQQFPVPIQIDEITPPPPPSSRLPSPRPTPQALDDAELITFFKADIRVVVCHSLTTPLPILLRPTTNAILVITSTSSPPTNPDLFLRQHVLNPHDVDLEQLKVLFVDPARAVHAVQALQKDPNSSTALQRYQDDFVGSKVATLTDALTSIFSTIDVPQSQNRNMSSSPFTNLRNQTALTQVNGALAACVVSLRRVKADINDVYADIHDLSGKVEEANAKVQGEVLGLTQLPDSLSARRDGGEVAKALKASEGELQIVMDRLTWWRMIWRVDDISRIVGSAVERAWCRELEKKLILDTGRLSALQKSLTSSMFNILSSRSTPPFNSPLLHNALLQICASSSYPLTPRTLTSPLHTRRTQIIEYPTTRLHLVGQKAALGTGLGVVTGVGTSGAGLIELLAGTGEGILGFVGIDAGAAIGVGALVSLVGVRWTVGAWERAKKKWWEDWARVGDALQRDLTETLDRTMRENVTVVAEKGCAGLLDLAKKRQDEIGEIEEELDELREASLEIEKKLRIN